MREHLPRQYHRLVQRPQTVTEAVSGARVYILASNDVRRLPPSASRRGCRGDRRVARVRSTRWSPPRARSAPVSSSASCSSAPAGCRCRCRRWSRRRTSTPSPPTRSRGSRATRRWSGASGASSAGTPRSWSRRANKRSDGIGGHLSTYASAASLYEVGFNHFFRGKDDGNSGDQIYYQGHAAPGMYSHAYLEGRITEAQLDNFRQETGGNGLSSYPHPRLMPEFWEFPTVSMGLGPLNAIYQARFNRYLYNRHIADTSESRVWCFLGDGECDEPETLGALSLAAREQLDNLIFVVNCNLQRLDGPVRGNGKVIQELEGIFRGAGWNVIKVIWAREWDELLARDVSRCARRPDEPRPRRRVPEVHDRKWRVHPRALLRPGSPPAQDGRAPVRRRPAPPPPRRPRLSQGVLRLQARARATRRADGDPRAHRQGMDPRHRLRRTQLDAPDQEDR